MLLLKGLRRGGVTAGFAALSLSGFVQAQAQNATHKQSVFLAPDQALAFGLTVPEDSATDLYFTLAVQKSACWGAVGLGSDRMDGALMLVVYASADGANVTLSPRRARHGHSEPSHDADVRVDRLEGSGSIAGNHVFRGRCRNCRSGQGGTVDAAAAETRAIYALGFGPPVESDDPAAPLGYHAAYGSFAIDLRAATGPAGPPLLDKDTAARSSGARLLSEQSGKREWASVVHAVVMVFCFVGLLPLGVVILRLGEWVRWHAANQTLALIGIIVGFGLGVRMSLLYNRSRNFSSPHQIIGLIVFALMFIQFFLGFFHHRIFKKTNKPTKIAPYHVWLGRLVMVLGVVNAFVGFPFALSPSRNYILTALVLVVLPVVTTLILCKGFIRRRLRKVRNEVSDEAPPGYDPEPWRHPGAVHYPAPGARDVSLDELDKDSGQRTDRRWFK